MSHSLAQTKNYIRKAFSKLIDPEPFAREINLLWTHFESKCAYCGRALTKSDRKGHVDHLDAAANKKLGRNHISNRVLSCNLCNGDEKREQNWELFLAGKCRSDETAFMTRREKIVLWQQNCGGAPCIDEELATQVERAIEVCNAVVDDQYKQMRLKLRELHVERSRIGGQFTI